MVRRTTARHWTVLLVVLFLILSMAVLATCGCGKGNEKSAKVPVEDKSQEKPSQETPTGADETEFSFIVCGDPQNNYEVFDKIVSAAKDVDFLIVAGDLTGSGTSTEFQNFLPHLEGKGIKYYLVPGNHDVATGPVSAYESFLGPRHQSFQHKNAYFVLFDNSDPNRGFDQQERDFVKAALDSRPKNVQHVFAVCHVPPGYPYSLSEGISQSSGINLNDDIPPVLSTGGVELLFCGHYHAYKRYKSDGLEVVITGGAGAPLQTDAEHGGFYHYILVKLKGAEKILEVIRI